MMCLTDLKTNDPPRGYDYWEGDHPEHPFEDWQTEVANRDTRLGYWAWVKARMSEE